MGQHKAVVKNYTKSLFFFHSGVTALVGSIDHHDNGRAYIHYVNTIVNILNFYFQLHTLMHFS